MKGLYKNILAATFLFQVGVAGASDTAVPHTFTPSTPAKASEVNENFQSLASSLQGVKKVSLEQNGSVIGKSLAMNMFKLGDTVLTNLFKLNTGYAIAPFNDISMGQVSLAPLKTRYLYFSSDNCSGTKFTDVKFKNDPVFGTSGYVIAAGGEALSVSSPLVRVENLVVKSVQALDSGTCTSLSEYLPYPGTGSGYCDAAYSQPGARIKELTLEYGYWVAPGDDYYDRNWEWLGTNENDDWFWNDLSAGNVVCQRLGVSAFATTRRDDGTNSYIDVESYELISAVDIGSAKTVTGILKVAIPVAVNNPAVTGVITAPCVNNRGKPAVCLPNAALKE